MFISFSFFAFKTRTNDLRTALHAYDGYSFSPAHNKDPVYRLKSEIIHLSRNILHENVKAKNSYSITRVTIRFTISAYLYNVYFNMDTV